MTAVSLLAPVCPARSFGEEVQRWALRENAPIQGRYFVDQVDRMLREKQALEVRTSTDAPQHPARTAIGLTGRVGVRVGPFGRIVLQVEECCPAAYRRGGMAPPRRGEPDNRPRSLIWRDASQSDLTSIRPLLVKSASEPAGASAGNTQ